VFSDIVGDTRSSALGGQEHGSGRCESTGGDVITGHKTVSVYQRYRIVNEDDRREALEKTQASLQNASASNVRPIKEVHKKRK
jgi:hypothetical protein